MSTSKITSAIAQVQQQLELTPKPASAIEDLKQAGPEREQGSAKNDANFIDLLKRVQNYSIEDQRGLIDSRNLEMPEFLLSTSLMKTRNYSSSHHQRAGYHYQQHYQTIKTNLANMTSSSSPNYYANYSQIDHDECSPSNHFASGRYDNFGVHSHIQAERLGQRRRS